MHSWIKLSLFFLSLSLSFFAFTSPATAVSATACAVTNFGSPPDNFPVPPECASPSSGIVFPPNMICKSDGYCQMPPSTDGSYQIYSCGGTATGKRWGRKELVGVLYTVAKRWREKNPGGYLRIGDMNAGNHLSHFWGIAVDINAKTPDKWAANRGYTGSSLANYDQQKTIELGKLIADTGYLYTIWYNDPVVQNAVFEYAKTSESAKRYKYTTNTGGNPGMRYVLGHYDHFHLNIGPNSFKLNYWFNLC